MANVTMQVTGDLNLAKWKCSSCGGILTHTQPIEFGASLKLVKAFSDAHKKCSNGG
jgi:hypothetical protein